MKILVSALEPSSNLHLQEVLKQSSNFELVGIFDKRFGKPLYDTSDMAIMGIVDAIKKLRWFFKVADEMVALAKDVDKILLMDSSGFNLPLAKKLKLAYPSKQIIYYILPQVWASRASRVKKLELYCDTLLGILPFEIEMYSSIKAHYIGHPLLDEIAVFNDTSISHNAIAYMAGSRASEIKNLLPIFKEIQKQLSDKRAILIIPKHFSQQKIDELYGDISAFEISKETHQSLSKVDYAFICSGTATLESALIGTPFSLVYIAKKIDFFIGRKILKIGNVGLANIILTHYNNTLLHKEFLQEEVNIENLLHDYHTHDKSIFREKAKALKEYLSHGSSKEVAKILES